MYFFLSYNTELVIGFINEPYTAVESDEEAFVEIGVISGSVQRNVAFQLAFSSGSAFGNFLKNDPQPSFMPKNFPPPHSTWRS